MMVLWHSGASSIVTEACRNENTSEEDNTPIPMDLSKSKPGHPETSADPIPLNLGNKNSFNTTASSIRPLSSSSRSSENIINNNNVITNNNNNNDIGAKSQNNYKSNSPVNFSNRRGPSLHQTPNNPIFTVVSSPHSSSHHQQQQTHRRSRKSDLRWRDSNSAVHGSGDDDDNIHSSPDSGLHRDSPGEEDEISSGKPLSPSIGWRNHVLMSTLSKYGNTFPNTPPQQKHPAQRSLFPLEPMYREHNHTSVSPESFSTWEDERILSEKTRGEDGRGGKVIKGAKLEEKVSQIKFTKSTVNRLSTGDDESSGDQVISIPSSEELVENGPTDLRSITSYGNSREKGMAWTRKEESGKMALNLTKEYDEERQDQPHNLSCQKSSSPRPDELALEQWKNQLLIGSSISPSLTDVAARLYGIDPETYQQQIMHLHLASMNPNFMSAVGSNPYLFSLYTQLLQACQAQQVLRQMAVQSSTSPQSITAQGERILTMNRSVTSTNSNNYHSPSPVSPASGTEGAAGMDSDSSMVGQTTPSSASGKRAPRAMTGRHVRTGTGALPSTLLTLRKKIEERQRMKAQKAKQEAFPNSQSKAIKNNNKYSKKPAKK